MEAKEARNKKKYDRKRIKISSKRQITIPAKYYDALKIHKEMECIYTEGMLILLPIRNEKSEFAEEILKDLINQGYSGEELLKEFKRINRNVRPAVEKMIEEADDLAKKVAEDYVDYTADIFDEE
jgi:bifunctional DNA-binding transcriptional regulator/antitoxin component of YhaV-PrlF toxin-antitoxin module